jgi:hypothetical protein
MGQFTVWLLIAAVVSAGVAPWFIYARLVEITALLRRNGAP